MIICNRILPTTDDSVEWAGLSVPATLMAAHTKLLGMTESGKTVTIRQMLQQLVGRCLPGSNIQIVVFDPKRELYSYILGMDPKVPVLLQDGTDVRGSAPDLAADITEPNQAKTAARLLVPDENSSQPYFFRAARRILEWDLRYLIRFADHWNLQDAFMILESVELLERVLPRSIRHKYFKPETTLRNTLSTLDTLTSRFETLAASWAKAEAEGRTLSLRDFAASSTSAILVIPRRLDIPDAVDPTIGYLQKGARNGDLHRCRLSRVPCARRSTHSAGTDARKPEAVGRTGGGDRMHEASVGYLHRSR